MFSHTGNISGKCSLRHLRKSQADDCSVTQGEQSEWRKETEGRRERNQLQSYLLAVSSSSESESVTLKSLLRANGVAKGERRKSSVLCN